MSEDLSIIVVSFNTREMTCACLESVFEQTRDVDFEVLVVDNASTDGSADAIAERFPQVRLIRSADNLGFAGANNLAAQQASGEFLLLLNPDTVVLDRAIERLHRFARQHGGNGIYGGRTYFPDGSLNPTSCWGRPTLWSALCRGLGLAALFRNNPLFDPESLGRWGRDSVRRVDIVTGCFFLIRRDLWNDLGGFDPAFFMYAEEADLCLRARRRGIYGYICPEAKIIHYGGASEKVRADKMVRVFRAKAQLFERHWRPVTARLGAATLDLWAGTRVAAYRILSLGSGRFAAGYRTWRAVWNRRRDWHLPIRQ